jgi:hypothetical protein
MRHSRSQISIDYSKARKETDPCSIICKIRKWAHNIDEQCEPWPGHGEILNSYIYAYQNN